MLIRYSFALTAAVAAIPALSAELSMKVQLPPMDIAEYHRPYVAAWIEKAGDQSYAGNVALWYDVRKRDNGGAKWLKEMRSWWRKSGHDTTVVDGVTGATRTAGDHVLNLLDAKSVAALAPGQYEVVVEAARENGGREVVRVPFEWPVRKAQSAKAQGSGELGAVELTAKPLNQLMNYAMQTPLRPRLALVACAALLSLSAHAHRPWLLPSTTLADGAAPVVSVDAAISEDLFEFDSLPLMLDALRVTAPDGSAVATDTRTEARRRVSFDVKLAQKGTYRIAGVTDTAMASWKVGGETKRWRGAPAALAREVPADAQDLQVTRQLARAETFVTNETPSALPAAITGEGLELLPLTNPTDLSVGDSTRFRMLLDGQPFAGADVTVIRGGNRYRYKMGEIALRTDAAGEFSVAWPEAGRYWLGVNHGGRPPGGPGAASSAPTPTPTTTPAGGARRETYSATFEVLPK